MDGTQLGQGRDSAREVLKENPEMQKELIDKIYAAIDEKKSAGKKK
jgi:hypothetical protein